MKILCHNVYSFPTQVPPKSENIRQAIFETIPDDFFLFQREFFIYNSVHDLFKNVIEEEGEDANILDFASTPFPLPGELTFNRGLEEPLVLENISPAGYRMWQDEFNGLDLAHALISLETYGKVHALGMVLLEKNVIDDDNLKKLLDVDAVKLMTENLLQMIEKGMTAFIDWLDENDDHDSKAKLKHLLEDRNYLTVFEEKFKKGKHEEIPTIIHGDARSNNIMFKYGGDGITPVGVVFIDFQMSYSFTHFFDLVYFFMISLSSDALIPNYPTLIQR